MGANDMSTAPPAGHDFGDDVGSIRRRRRLDHLLDLRQRLAVVAAEQRAHRLTDAPDTFGQQLAVENALELEFPTVFARRWPDWAHLDAELDHDPRTLMPGCSICQAIASHAGVNLTPPAAA